MKARQRGTEVQKDQSSIANPAVGKNNKPRKIEFLAKATAGSKVFLAGSFNNWDPKAVAMKHNGDSQYKAIVSLPPGRHEYKFVINGIWHMDEQCRQWVPNSFGSLNSVVEVS